MTRAALKKDAITVADLEKYVSEKSDFSFEMKALSELTRLGFGCTHSGTYQDPVTRHMRQYDIRAVKRREAFDLTLAVECKNLRDNYPLLVSAVPRKKNEAYHEVIVIHPRRGNETEIRKVTGWSIYRAEDMVGKTLTHVGVTERKNELTGDDSETFERINQAVNSAKELVVEAMCDASPPFIRVVVPVIVVPKGTLFQTEYDASGNLTKPPYPVEQATLFLEHEWSHEKGIEGRLSYTMTHLHIVMFDSLATATQQWMGANGFFKTFD
jgi:hypothetical protein